MNFNYCSLTKIALLMYPILEYLFERERERDLDLCSDLPIERDLDLRLCLSSLSLS